MNTNLSNKTALITGASRGIGKSVASYYAGAGARVIIHYNNDKKAAEEFRSNLDGDHMIQKADLADPLELESTGL